MVPVARGLAVGFGVLVVVLAGLVGRGLGVAPAVAGLACGVALCVAVSRGSTAMGAKLLGPADLVTLTRALLACALAALIADMSLAQTAAALIVPVALLALSLDAVDGRVARATRTMSAFGARLDGEADAFLLLVLSVYVARSFGVWVLAIGLARYVFGAAGWVWPWLRTELPFRYWRKVVTAVQGIALVVAVVDLVPRAAAYTALFLALALLAESFGRDVLWLWARRPVESFTSPSAVRGARLRVP